MLLEEEIMAMMYAHCSPLLQQATGPVPCVVLLMLACLESLSR